MNENVPVPEHPGTSPAPEAQQGCVCLRPQLTDVLNYALQQDRLPILPSLTIENHTEEALEGLTLTVEGTPDVLMPFTQHIERVPANAELVLKGLDVRARAEALAGLTERVPGSICLTLRRGEEMLARHEAGLTILAFDEWHGIAFFPELAAAFITPNHPEVAKLCAQATGFLRQWTGDPSLDAYQRGSPARVRQQAAAIYAAVQAQDIVYSVPPASYEAIGQRVRLCDAVLAQKLGTCLDLTLLYAACLEAIGLHPLLVFQPGHVFAGVWLEDETFPEAVQDDPALLTKRLADGIGEVLVVECTAMAAGKAVGFDAACAVAERALNAPVDCIVDVRRARLSGIHPLPQRVHSESGWRVVAPERDEREITAAPREREAPIPVAEAPAAPTGKVAQWERKLLDLGLRNALINLRLTQGVIPLLTDAPGDLEDALASGAEYGIAPAPAEWDKRADALKDPAQLADVAPYRELLRAEFENHRLRSALDGLTLGRAVTRLYRTARTSLEENGANTLYLALGLLRWYETRASERPRYAPLVLLPVELVRRSANRGYVIRLRDEEPQMNITLLEMLKQDFGISIGGLDPLPGDGHGIDLRAVYTIIRRAVMDQPRWDVVEAAYLGIFSFTQFVMWNDIRNRVDDLARNKLVRSLIDGKLSWPATAMQPGGRVDEAGTLLPLSADASQLYAIQQAASGRSFVLHGPPGTGKSQTITALIANALAQGKTVLFVAEKMAALSVVQSRLERIGIRPFCLELHSNKSRKRDVLEQLHAATEVVRGRPKASWEAASAQAAALRAELDAYATALHRARPCGQTLSALAGLYEDLREAPALAPLPTEAVAALSGEGLLQREQLAGHLVAAAREVGHPAGHALRLMGGDTCTPALREALAEACAAALPALEKLGQASEALAGALGMPAPANAGQFRDQLRLAGTLGTWLALPAAWTRSAEPETLFAGLGKLCGHLQAAQEGAQSLAARWQDSFLEKDAAALQEAWTQAALKWFLPRKLAQRRIARLLAPCARGNVDMDTLEGDLLRLAKYREAMAGADSARKALGTALDGVDTSSPGKLQALTQEARQARAALAALAGADAPARLAAQPGLAGLASAVVDACAAAKARWEALLPLLAPEEGVLDGMVLGDVCAALQGIPAALPGLKDWCVWNAACRAAQDAGMGALVDAYRAGLKHEEALPAWQRAVAVALIEGIVATEPALHQFSGAVFNEKIRQFRALDARLTGLARTEIFCRLAANVPDLTQAAANSSELGILQRAIRSGGRGVSIRRLFGQIPTLLPLLCPCMLMSPLSVAQYLEPTHRPFDLVVFDEASQLPTCKAVGALARGEDAVIVGDPRQMPPTSFFSGNTVDEDDLEHEDLESILDDCLALNMPESHLLWHYRSRHESLIAFSNREFYENRLYTFPSADDRESMVRLVHVDGCFDRGHTRQNRAEAEAVVGELARRAHDPACSGRSVGVVTFNIQQQNLISDLLDEACANDEVLEKWAFHAEEPLFIKNLENVQGDERDVILFSIGYGPDAGGRVTMNFGPLNREGGWRRLNVAVSRARCEMVVYATLRPEQIDLSRTSARGVAALRSFLAYAQGGTLPENTASARDAHIDAGGVARDICAGLQKHGYRTRTMVGHSKYRLDIGVIDPRQPGRYLLGIPLDGDAYREARTTRDRELAQPAILEGLGWHLHRVWTMDWLENREKELSRLLGHLETLLNAPLEAPGPPRGEAPASVAPAPAIGKAPTMPAIETVPAATSEAAPYRVAQPKAIPLSADGFLLPSMEKRILAVLGEVVAQEGPVSEALLMRRTVQAFGIARAGSRIQAHLRTLLARLPGQATVQDGQRFYWPPSQDPGCYEGFRSGGEDEEKRDARDLPVQEVANAATAVLRRQIGLPEEDLIRETARLLGYARLGANMREAICAGIAHGVSRARIAESRPGYYTLPHA